MSSESSVVLEYDQQPDILNNKHNFLKTTEDAEEGISSSLCTLDSIIHLRSLSNTYIYIYIYILSLLYHFINSCS